MRSIRSIAVRKNPLKSARRPLWRRPCPEQAADRLGASPIVIAVTFDDPAGERWTAIGGGETIADAIDFAKSSSPAGRDWEPVHWEPLFGE